MRHSGRRLLALAAVSAGALVLLGAPASALTLATPPALGPVPLPISIGVSAEPGNPVAVNVNGPDATGVDVSAGPNGVHAGVKAVPSLPIDVTIALPAAPRLPSPIDAPVPVPGAAPVLPANPAAPTQSVSPTPTGGGVTSNPGTPRPGTTKKPSGTPLSASVRAINATRDNATRAGADVTASITPSPGSGGVLSALRTTDARIMLWLALAALIVVIRLCVGSATSKATRAA